MSVGGFEMLQYISGIPEGHNVHNHAHAQERLDKGLISQLWMNLRLCTGKNEG